MDRTLNQPFSLRKTQHYASKWQKGNYRHNGLVKFLIEEKSQEGEVEDRLELGFRTSSSGEGRTLQPQIAQRGGASSRPQQPATEQRMFRCYYVIRCTHVAGTSIRFPRLLPRLNAGLCHAPPAASLRLRGTREEHWDRTCRSGRPSRRSIPPSWRAGGPVCDGWAGQENGSGRRRPHKSSSADPETEDVRAWSQRFGCGSREGSTASAALRREGDR